MNILGDHNLTLGLTYPPGKSIMESEFNILAPNAMLGYGYRQDHFWYGVDRIYWWRWKHEARRRE